MCLGVSHRAPRRDSRSVSGMEGARESHYLNIGIMGLEKLVKLGEVGGILGLDDNKDAMVPPSDCLDRPQGDQEIGRREALYSEEDWPSKMMFVGGR